jgi:2-iminoacetate synthase
MRREFIPVLVYQRNHQKSTKNTNLKEKKSNFDRLDTPDRIGKAGIHKIGLAALLGLEDWRTDGFNALHLGICKKPIGDHSILCLSLVCDLQKEL